MASFFFLHQLGKLLDGLVEPALLHEIGGRGQLLVFDFVLGRALDGHEQMALQGGEGIGTDDVAVAAGGDGAQYVLQAAVGGDHDRRQHPRTRGPAQGLETAEAGRVIDGGVHDHELEGLFPHGIEDFFQGFVDRGAFYIEF